MPCSGLLDTTLLCSLLAPCKLPGSNSGCQQAFTYWTISISPALFIYIWDKVLFYTPGWLQNHGDPPALGCQDHKHEPSWWARIIWVPSVFIPITSRIPHCTYCCLPCLQSETVLHFPLRLWLSLLYLNGRCFSPSCLDRSLALLGRTSEKQWNALLSALDQELLSVRVRFITGHVNMDHMVQRRVNWVSLLQSTTL